MSSYLVLMVLLLVISFVGFNFNQFEKAYISRKKKRMIKKLRRKSYKKKKKH